ncbi:AAA family ATPase [uncultured Phocaeicola sp.]|uniref:AAA family ATPase n=1 Tax=uncultured Phocaeicola sp. TaxID=990718 RepID=UPI0030C6F491
MITHLSINNLKLHDHTDLELNGLTILTGMNGMGKSTVIQSLILLRQSFMMNDLDSGLNLKGDLCDAGISGELACQASAEHTLQINMKFAEQNDLNFAFGSYEKSVFYWK